MRIWKFLILGLLGITQSGALAAQQTFAVSVANHAIALPGGSFSAPFHPGIEASWLYPVRQGERWNQSLACRLGFFHQRLVHDGVQLYAEYSWLYRLLPGLYADMGAGLGYLHTFEHHEIFRQDAAGIYRRTGQWGKPHLQASAVLGLLTAPPGWPVRPFLQYRFRVMYPFVQEYVPFLPATSLHLGLQFDLNLKKDRS
jgi:hypothetical protein